MDFDINIEYDKIYRYCYFKLRHGETAEDITQETFLKYFSQTSYISKGKPLAYLYTIAKNLCIDYLRKAQTLPLDDDYTKGDTFKSLDMQITVKDAIKSMPTELQELVLLRYVNELQINEIATITKKSRFWVHRKLKVALEEIKHKLGEEFYNE